jgi:hypothetical protein
MLLIPSFLLDNGLNNEERSWEPLIFHNVVRLSISLPPIHLLAMARVFTAIHCSR